MVKRISADMISADVGDYCLSARSSKTGWLLCDGGAYSRTVHAALFALIGTAFGSGDGSTTFNVPGPQGKALVIAGSGTIAESFSAASVTPASDLITVASNADKWVTGVKVRATTTGALPTGLALATDYFVIRMSATTIKLASSLANAIAGTPIDITATGSGTHTLTCTLTTRAIGDIGGEEAHADTVNEMPPHAHSGGMTNGGGSYAGGGANSERVPANTGSAGGGAAHNNMPPFIGIGNLFIYSGVPA
jgi:microcystin-dependent protein